MPSAAAKVRQTKPGAARSSKRKKAADPKLLVSLLFEGLDVDRLHHVRSFVERFIAAHPNQISEDAVSGVTLAMHEMLENAINYGRTEETTVEIRMNLMEPNRPLIRTSNRATAADARRVKGLIGQLSDMPARDLYRQLMMETVRRKEGSGLGLVRIAAECNMAMSATFKNGKLTVEALARGLPQ